MLILIVLGIGGGMTYGRWRAERIRARQAADKAWADRKKIDYREHKRWRRLY